MNYIVYKINDILMSASKFQFTQSSARCSYGATENAGVEHAIRALRGWKMQEWKKQEWIAGVENAGVNRMEHQPEIILRKPQVTLLDLSLFF